MFTLTKWFTFDASHQLTDHDGACSNLHGHTWRLGVVLQGTDTQEAGAQRGMLRDYGRLKALVNSVVLPHLDHRHLNDSLPVYPTSENVARWVYQVLQPCEPLLVAVIVCETPDSSCEYRPYLTQ